MVARSTTEDVVIVGAGPTGLVLAHWLTRLGITPRIVDEAPEPGRTSRAIGVQARTLEQYRQLGLAADVMRAGAPTRAVNLWVEGERRAHIELDEVARSLSPFPYVLVYPQDEHERLLIARLADLGVKVERPVALVGLEAARDRAVVTLRHGNGEVETCKAIYVAGCDGARSRTREALRIGYPGGTYAHQFYVADVEGTGPAMDGEAHFAWAGESNFLACLAFAPGHVRLIGTIRADAVRDGETLGWDDVSNHVIDRLRLDVRRVNWFSTYHVHHRVASAFRVGPAFLLGDAAHIHSPVGGQGMNTGIGDAANLGWKLAAVLRGRADPEILDTYEEERIPFAQRLVHTTDRVFELLASDGPFAKMMRVHIAPGLLASLVQSEAVRRFLFNTVSQIGINYRGSRLSEGRAGDVRGGDRLPWVSPLGGADNFDPLTSLEWQAHVYGDLSGPLADACGADHVPLHTFPWHATVAHAGLVRDALYLIRPDGYVALAAEGSGAADRLRHYIQRWKLRPSGTSPAVAPHTMVT